MVSSLSHKAQWVREFPKITISITNKLASKIKEEDTIIIEGEEAAEVAVEEEEV